MKHEKFVGFVVKIQLLATVSIAVSASKLQYVIKLKL